MSSVVVYMASSLDGFIAGPGDDLAWLLENHSAPGDLAPHADALRFDEFLSGVGAMLMGRRTYDVVTQMHEWPYGETPLLVATRRALDSSRSTVQAVQGDIVDLVQHAKELADERDVYLDGGDLVRQALDAHLVDEIVVTWVPVLLGDGIRLFEKLQTRTRLQFTAHHTFDGGLVQLRSRILRD